MPDGQRVVGDETFREHPLVTFAGLLRLGEIVGEVRADQLFATRTGDFDGGFVHVGDFSLRADRDERVHARFDQAARVLRGLLLRGDVARGGEHSQHVAARVLVDRSVVQHVGEASIGMADRQRVVRDEAFREHPLVTLASLFGFGEIVREVRVDKLFAGCPGHLHRRFIDVGDFACGADSHERVHARFDQAARILRSLLLSRDVTNGAGDLHTLLRLKRAQADLDLKFRSILALAVKRSRPAPIGRAVGLAKKPARCPG